MDFLKLTVLMGGVPERLLGATPAALVSLLKQAENKDVEVIYLVDNKKRKIGPKRTALLQLAQGRYVSCVDDDDEIPDDYIDQLLLAIETNPNVDVIVFPMKASFDGKNEGIVEQSIFQPEQEQYKPGQITLRRPAQLACWKTKLVQDISFPDLNSGEDYIWGDQACARAKTEVRVDKVLYHYRWQSNLRSH